MTAKRFREIATVWDHIPMGKNLPFTPMSSKHTVATPDVAVQAQSCGQGNVFHAQRAG